MTKNEREDRAFVVVTGKPADCYETIDKIVRQTTGYCEDLQPKTILRIYIHPDETVLDFIGDVSAVEDAYLESAGVFGERKILAVFDRATSDGTHVARGDIDDAHFMIFGEKDGDEATIGLINGWRFARCPEYYHGMPCLNYMEYQMVMKIAGVIKSELIE